MPAYPGADRPWIGLCDDPRCVGGRVLRSMSINSDPDVKTQHSPARDANPIAWNDTEHQCAVCAAACSLLPRLPVQQTCGSVESCVLTR